MALQPALAETYVKDNVTGWVVEAGKGALSIW